MKVAFADTSFLYSFHNTTDINHKKVREYINLIVTRKIEPVDFIISDFVFSEIVTRILRKVNKKKSIEVMKELNNSKYIKIDYISPFIFRKSQEYYEKYKDKDWSFVDFTTYAYMKEKGISIIASVGHRHINEFGFEVIP